jgi:hypothetical protein
MERLDDRRKIVGVAVHIVSAGGLAGSPMTSAVMRDDAETVLREEKHLAIPGVRIQRPSVRKRHDRTFAPVLVIDLRSVFGFDCAHMACSFLFGFCELPWVELQLHLQLYPWHGPWAISMGRWWNNVPLALAFAN